MRKHLLIVAILFATSCGKNENVAPNSPSNWSSGSLANMRTVNMTATEQDIVFYGVLPKYANETSVSQVEMNYALTQLGSNEFELVSRDLIDNIPEFELRTNETVTGCIGYLQQTEFDTEECLAISIITRYTDGYYFRHFQKSSSENLVLYKDAIMRFSSFTFTDLITLFPFHSVTSSNPNLSIYVVNLDSQSHNFNEYEPLAKRLMDIDASYRPIGPGGGGGSGCESCSMGSSGDCDVDQDGTTQICRGGNDCRVAHIDDDPTNPIVDVDSLYTFRDNFLASSNTGNKYIAYYEYISYFINKFDLPEGVSASDEINFLLSTITVANKLSYGSLSQVVLDDAYASLAMGYIRAYQEHITHSNFDAVLDLIAADVQYYKGKTRATILSEL